MQVRFPNDQRPPEQGTKVEVKVQRRVPERPGEVSERVMTLAPAGGSKLAYEGALTQTPEGFYRFQLQSPAVPSPPRAECKVVAPPDEMYGLRMDEVELRAAADASGGGFYNLADAPKLLDDLPEGQRTQLNPAGPPYLLWASVLTFLVVLALLSAEWLLRKEWNLL